MTLEIPHNALVMMVGPAGSGKSTFAHKHFPGTYIVSSDECRRIVCDDMTDQDHNTEVFDLFHRLIDVRLRNGRLTVADATHLTTGSRENLRKVAQRYGVPLIPIVLDIPLSVCMRQNEHRDRQVPEHIVKKHYKRLEGCLPSLEALGNAYVVRDPDSVRVYINTPMQTAPGWDCVGDLHGCAYELRELLESLGYQEEAGWQHREGRRLILLGDLTDRGPLNYDTLLLAMELEATGHIVLAGNHCDKLRRALKGNPVKPAHGLSETLRELDFHASADAKRRIYEFLCRCPYHVTVQVDEPGHPDLVAVHAGIPIDDIGKTDKRTREHCIYGDVRGFSKDGLPNRQFAWLEGYSDPNGPFCVYGHTVVPEPSWNGNTVNIDTGAVFGGRLTALRWPEREIVQVEAAEVYCEDKSKVFA